MNKLWAPWRINYISQKPQRSCIFCEIVKSKNDKSNNVFLRSRCCFAVLNTFPYNNGHTMIVPYRHIASWEKLTDEEILDLNKTMIKVMARLKKVLKPQAFNTGMNIGKFAGAGIAQHIHLHIVPRWAGDTNFMPVIAGTKIISQSLSELYKQLVAKLK